MLQVSVVPVSTRATLIDPEQASSIVLVLLASPVMDIVKSFVDASPVTVPVICMLSPTVVIDRLLSTVESLSEKVNEPLNVMLVCPVIVSI